MIKYLIVILLIAAPDFVTAQSKQTTSARQIWLAYNNQARFSDKWGIWADFHLRTRDDFVDHLSQTILRFGLTYYIDDVTKLTAGYAYISAYPSDKHKSFTQPEHRPWQQLQWHTKYGKKRMMQWIRLEERYRRRLLNDSTLGDTYSFNFRLRYNILFQVPLSEKGLVANSFSFIANDELHINFGKQIVNNYFDQNRFFVGLGYHVNASDQLQAGYMNVFQQLAAGNQYRNLHTARIFYFHNLDLRKKK